MGSDCRIAERAKCVMNSRDFSPRPQLKTGSVTHFIGTLTTEYAVPAHPPAMAAVVAETTISLSWYHGKMRASLLLNAKEDRGKEHGCVYASAVFA